MPCRLADASSIYARLDSLGAWNEHCAQAIRCGRFEMQLSELLLGEL